MINNVNTIQVVIYLRTKRKPIKLQFDDWGGVKKHFEAINNGEQFIKFNKNLILNKHEIIYILIEEK